MGQAARPPLRFQHPDGPLVADHSGEAALERC
jgi:hypothetical protein